MRVALEDDNRDIIFLVQHFSHTYDELYASEKEDLVLMPRSLFPGKPQNTQRVVAQWINPEVENYTVPPGIIGDLYINFGVLGIISMVVFGFVIGQIEKMTGLVALIFTGV